MLAAVIVLTLTVMVGLVVVVYLLRRVSRLERQQRQTQVAVADTGEAIAKLANRRSDSAAGPGAVPVQRRRRHLRALPVILAGCAWVAHRAREHPLAAAGAATGAAAALTAGFAAVPLLLGPESGSGQLDVAPPPAPPARTVGPPPPADTTPTPDPEPDLPDLPARTQVPAAATLPPTTSLPAVEDPGAGDGLNPPAVDPLDTLPPAPLPDLPEATTPPLPPPPAPVPSPAPLPSPEPEEGEGEEGEDDLLCVDVEVRRLVDEELCLR